MFCEFFRPLPFLSPVPPLYLARFSFSVCLFCTFSLMSAIYWWNWISSQAVQMMHTHALPVTDNTQFFFTNVYRNLCFTYIFCNLFCWPMTTKSQVLIIVNCTQSILFEFHQRKLYFYFYCAHSTHTHTLFDDSSMDVWLSVQMCTIHANCYHNCTYWTLNVFYFFGLHIPHTFGVNFITRRMMKLSCERERERDVSLQFSKKKKFLPVFVRLLRMHV